MTYDEKIEFIINNYKLMTAKEIANIVGFTLQSVQRIAWRNNIHKDKEYVDDIEKFYPIKNFDNYLINKDGVIIRKKDNLIIIHTYTKDKYHSVKLINNNGKRKTLRVHRLVALTFIDNPNNLPEVNHKDGNKEHNFVNNLEWISSSNNQKHAYKNNLRKPSNVDYQEKDIHQICKYIVLGYSTKEIISLMNFKFTKQQINRIKRKDTWSKISNKYF